MTKVALSHVATVRRRESAMDVGKRVILSISALEPPPMEMVARMEIITWKTNQK